MLNSILSVFSLLVMHADALKIDPNRYSFEEMASKELRDQINLEIREDVVFILIE